MGEIVGIVLAAGEGTRFGDENKLLEQYQHRPLIEHAVSTLQGGAVDHVIAVLGHEYDRMQDTVEGLVDEIKYNPRFGEGMSTSVQLGATAATRHGADGAVFLPGDMPCVAHSTIEQLVATYDRGHGEIIIPTYASFRGNPVLFGSAFFGDLAGLSGDVGGRQLFDSEQAHRITVDDPGIRIDIDTTVELEALRAHGCGDQLRNELGR